MKTSIRIKTLVILFILICVGKSVFSQEQPDKKAEVKRFFELRFRTNYNESTFLALAKKVEGVEDVTIINYSNGEGYIKIFTMDGVRATPDFIQGFCIKSGLKEILIDEKYVPVNLVSESIKNEYAKKDGRSKEH